MMNNSEAQTTTNLKDWLLELIRLDTMSSIQLQKRYQIRYYMNLPQKPTRSHKGKDFSWLTLHCVESKVKSSLLSSIRAPRSSLYNVSRERLWLTSDRVGMFVAQKCFSLLGVVFQCFLCLSLFLLFFSFSCLFFNVSTNLVVCVR